MLSQSAYIIDPPGDIVIALSMNAIQFTCIIK